MNANHFGAFSISLVIYSLVLGLSQAAVGEPALLTFHRLTPHERQRAGLACMVAGAGLGVASGALLAVAAALFMSASLAACVQVLALALPVLVAHDCGRFAFIAAGRATHALAADLAWTILWAGWVLLDGIHSAPGGLAVWGLTSAAGAAYSIFALGRRLPGRKELLDTLGSDVPLRLRLVGEYMSVNAGYQLTVLGFSAVAGLTVGGGVRAAQSLLGPLNTVINAVRVISTPEAAKRFRRTGVATAGLPTLVSIGLVAMALVTGTVALLLPDAVGQQLLGESWTVAQRVMLVIVLHRVLSASALGPIGMLRSAGQAGPLMVRRGTAEIAGGVVCVIVTLAAGPWWGVTAMLLTPTLDTTLTWSLLWRTRRRQQVADIGSPEASRAGASRAGASRAGASRASAAEVD